MAKATHVLTMQSIDIATGEGESWHEYGYYGPYSPSQYGSEWIVVKVTERIPTILSANTVSSWARNDGVEW